MKVLHIITGLYDGGAEASLYRICTARMPETGHVVVSLSGEGKYSALLRRSGIEVHSLDMPRGRLTLAGLRELLRLIRRERPDVVQTWMYHANLAGGLTARLAGHRNIVWGIHHTDLAPESTSRGTRLVNRLSALLSRWLPKRIVSCAESAARVHAAIGYDREKFVVIPNGYDLRLFYPDPTARLKFRDEMGLGETTPLVGMIARWDPQKDHDNLLHAMVSVRTKIAAVKCMIVGTGCDSDNKVLIKKIKDLALEGSVIMLGPRSDIPAVMNALDVNVLSSAYGEAFPNAVAEAMACGTPCVVTDVGDAALIVGESGWVVPPRNAPALAAAICDALGQMRDRPAWAARRRAARRRIEDNFSLRKVAASYREVWTGISSP
ncbi:MAG: glycosyltransferase [Devosia sp.]|nr:glycosyltransferase [Devosia sp.]